MGRVYPPVTSSTRTEHSPIQTHCSGTGHLQVSLHNHRSVVTRCRATSPLKLLTPRTRSRASWIYSSTFGGGLVGGDNISLDLTVNRGATCFLGTQSSTKIYPRRDGLGCHQSLRVKIEPGAVAVIAPDPICCFAGSDYSQRQRCDLHQDAGLILIDSLVSGRRARGERWAMSRYSTVTEIAIDGEDVFRDATILDPVDGPLTGVHRMGRFDCILSLVMIGRLLAVHCAAILQSSAQYKSLPDAPGPFACSEIAGGLLLRVVGDNYQSVVQWLSQLLQVVPTLLGEDPWTRKW